MAQNIGLHLRFKNQEGQLFLIQQQMPKETQTNIPGATWASAPNLNTPGQTWRNFWNSNSIIIAGDRPSRSDC